MIFITMYYKVSAFIGLLVMLLVSCKTNKDLVYFNNASNNELIEDVQNNAPIYIVKSGDNLFVEIQSINPEINAVFNPTQRKGTQSGVQQNYGQLSSQYLNGYFVDVQGNICLPMIGDVSVIGLSLEDANKRIQAKVDEYIKDATVKVKLLSYKITVLGEVKNPGVYYNYNNSLTVLEAISMARGITDYAHVKRVLVVRSAEKGSKTFRLNLTDKKFLKSDAFFLQPNDVVYVQPDKYKSIKLNSTFYSLMLSSVSTLILILNVLK